MHTSDIHKNGDNQHHVGRPVDEHMKIIHHHYVPPFDLITCEILDSILQHATTEQIAQFSQLHPDTVRRMFHVIESTLDISTHSQIIDNCLKRHWSSHIYRHNHAKTHTFE